MPTINQLSAVDQINDGDQFPLYSPNAGDARKASFTTVKESLAGDFASLADLAAQTGAGLVGTSNGTTVQQALDARPTISALAASSGSSLVGHIASGAGATARTVQSKLQETVSVKDFGAVGDGVTNDRAAIAAAVAAARGKRILFPEGNYLINTDGGSITLEEVALEAETVLDGATATLDQGVNFYITGTTNSPFRVRRGVSIEGFGFYYPDQPDSATPIAYPSTLNFDFATGAVQFVEINRNVVYNAFRFIEIDTIGNPFAGVGHIEVVSNYICALNRAIYMTYNVEHFRIIGNNFTFGFWLASTEGGARAYMRANATAIQIDQSDGVEIVDNLFFGHLNGVLCSATGLCQFMNVSLNKFDQVRYGVKATGAGNFGGAIIGNNFVCYNTQNTALESRSIQVTTNGSNAEQITISGNQFLIAADEHIFVSGNTPVRTVVVGPQNFLSWARFKSSGTFGAISVSGALTSLSVTGGWFNGANNPTRSLGVTGQPNTVTVTGAVFNACQNPVSLTSNVVTSVANTSFTTAGSTSDVISATAVWQTGNNWDKPSLTSTKPFFLVRKNASQTFNSGSATDVTWETEASDRGGNFSTPSFTAAVAGRYRFAFSLLHDNTGTAGDRWQLSIVTSNGSFSQSYKMIADFNSVGFSAEVELSAGQTAKLQIARVGGAGNFVTFNDAASNYFCGSLIE